MSDEILVTYEGQGGRDGEKEAANKFFEVGKQYKVTDVDLGPFDCYIYVEGSNVGWNICLFKNDIPMSKLKDFKHIRLNEIGHGEVAPLLYYDKPPFKIEHDSGSCDQCQQDGEDKCSVKNDRPYRLKATVDINGCIGVIPAGTPLIVVDYIQRDVVSVATEDGLNVAEQVHPRVLVKIGDENGSCYS